MEQHNDIQPLGIEEIKTRIYEIRGLKVMLDRDLAELYNIETKVLNQSIKRNSNRFPENFRFQITEIEMKQLVTICDRFKTLKHSNTLPYAFTEQGVAMLSALLKSDIAIKTSIQIIEAFVSMRRFLVSNAGLFQRLEQVEKHQIITDQKIDSILNGLEDNSLKEKSHIFSAGQIFEAKSFITELIRKATNRIILVDGYVSAPTINLLDARQEGIMATIYTSGVGNSLQMLMKQHNIQYPQKQIDIKKWRTEQHDRWLIIDNELWHCGASIRDAGIRTFGIDIIGLDVNIILGQL